VVVEWLKYQVPREWHEIFLKADADIWTAMLSGQAGFIQKQIWLTPEAPDVLNLLIFWETKAHWKTTPEARLRETQQTFVQKVGRSFTLTEVLEYEII
jgi:uncharacterized protein (TIGR03792 family)